MKLERHKLQNRRGAFTLIELLVVIAIIGILAGLILATAGLAWNKARPARVGAERDTIITAIQRYKQDKGFFPPDNPNNSVINPLFYELTGMVAHLAANGAPDRFTSPVTTEVFQVADLPALFGIQGFVNSSADPNSPARNYFDKVALGGRTWTFSSGVATSPSNTIFGVAVKGPPLEEMHASTGAIIVPFNYVSSHPTNMPDSYDLWIDITYGGGGKNNRISNWSKDPQPF